MLSPYGPSRSITEAHAARGLCAVAAVLVGVPAASVAWSVLTSREPSSPLPDLLSPRRVALTLAVASTVALLATTAAWPIAWTLRRAGGWRRRALVAAAMLPVLLPSYLAYSGWGVLRDPSLPLGDWVQRLASSGWPELPRLVGRVLAVLGLALWATPIAAVVLAPGVGRLDRSVLDALRLDAGRWRRRASVARMALPAIAAASTLVFVVALGSAVPIHLAQFETTAISLWFAIEQTAPDARGGLWLAQWPWVLAAAVTAAATARWALAASDHADEHDPSASGPRLHDVMTAAYVVLALAGPPVALAMTLRSWAALADFWRTTGPAVASSSLVAVATGVSGAAVAAAVMFAVGGRGHRAAGVAVVALAAASLVPGVLVGLAWADAGRAEPTGRLADSALIVALAHLSRFAGVAALAGVWLGMSEDRSRRDARRVDGADTLTGWAEAGLAPRAGAVAAAGLACAALSLHEIEASVIVLPPGVESLPRTLLNHLHYFREQELAAAVLWVAGLSLAMAGVSLRLWRRA